MFKGPPDLHLKTCINMRKSQRRGGEIHVNRNTNGILSGVYSSACSMHKVYGGDIRGGHYEKDMAIYLGENRRR